MPHHNLHSPKLLNIPKQKVQPCYAPKNLTVLQTITPANALFCNPTYSEGGSGVTRALAIDALNLSFTNFNAMQHTLVKIYYDNDNVYCLGYLARSGLSVGESVNLVEQFYNAGVGVTLHCSSGANGTIIHNNMYYFEIVDDLSLTLIEYNEQVVTKIEILGISNSIPYSVGNKYVFPSVCDYEPFKTPVFKVRKEHFLSNLGLSESTMAAAVGRKLQQTTSGQISTYLIVSINIDANHPDFINLNTNIIEYFGSYFYDYDSFMLPQGEIFANKVGNPKDSFHHKFATI